MKPIKIFHIPGFRSTRAVWMFYELKQIYGSKMPELEIRLLDPETIRTDKPADLLEANPNGKIPAMIDQDIVMWDGTAICYYLLEKYDTEGILAPKNDFEFRAKLHQFSFYASGTVDQLSARSSTVEMVLEGNFFLYIFIGGGQGDGPPLKQF